MVARDHWLGEGHGYKGSLVGGGSWLLGTRDHWLGEGHGC